MAAESLIDFLKQPLPTPQTVDPAHCEQLRRTYLDVLRLFAGEADPPVLAEIVEREACRIDGVLVQFRLRPATDQIALQVDLGKPEPWQAPAALRRALELQLSQGTPALWIVARHPVSGHGVLLSHFDLGASAAEDAQRLRRQTDVCVAVSHALRQYLYH